MYSCLNKYKKVSKMFNQGDNSNHNTLENHSTDVHVPYSENYTPTISIQPQITGATRRPVPVLTNFQSSNVSQFIPMHGLEFLLGLQQVNLQQTVELNELLANEVSENRYVVKVPEGETIYYGSETSSSCQRMCFGPSRSFVMKLYDRTHQEALEFRRRLGCGLCSFWCYLQEMEVYITPDEPIGTIKQQMNINTPVFLVYNKQHNVVYRIEGPTACGCFSFNSDSHFRIYSPDGMSQVGSMNRQWDQVQLAYNLYVQFPNHLNDTEHKALLLGAAFLLEYLYFSKTSGCRCAC